MKQVFFNPKKVEKIILLSATISENEVQQLGLTGKRVIYLEVDSPIPVEQRPVYYRPICNMSLTYQPKSIPIIAEALADILKVHKGKGLLHAPYALAQKLFAALQAIAPDERKRFVFHDKGNKSEIFNDWLNSPIEEGKVLVGSGMYEGLDLKGDEYGFQCILKIPFPSLAEPAVRWLAEKNERYYAWITIRDVVHTAFERLHDKNKELFPKYFRDALQL
jgi:Rad3-related DNA helicase